MHRLHGADALFLYSETPTQHMHTLKIGILTPGSEGYSFEHEKQKLAARLHRAPPFRWRVIPTPLALHHPLFVESEVDMDFHVRRAALPAPGGAVELGELIAEIASRPLDRSKPLWEMWVVEGLTGGRVAFVCKIHHTLADGVASAELLNEFLTHDSDEELPRGAPVFRPEPVPARGERLRAALRDLADFLPHALRELAKNVRAVREHRRAASRWQSAASAPPRAASAPRTSFSRVLSAQRRFAFTALPLSEANAARKALGATHNDLALALAAGALRSYLLRRGELPAERLIASVPVSRRTEADKGRYGNHTSVMYVPLATDLADAGERFRATQAAALAAKRLFQETKGAQLSDWLELFPPFVSRAVFSRLPTWLMRVGRPPQANLIVSNVPGAREVLYYGKTPVAEFYSVGPLLEGIALNLTIWSYGDALELSVLADRDALRDAWELVADLRAAFEELVKLAAAQPARAS